MVDKAKVKARFIGKYTVILGDVEVSEGTWIGYFCLLDGQAAPLKIGRNCELSSGCQILTHSTHLRCAASGKKVVASVEIGDNVFVGTNAVIVPNKNGSIQIGHHSIIGALSLVNQDVPPVSVVAGTPAKVVKKIEHNWGFLDQSL